MIVAIMFCLAFAAPAARSQSSADYAKQGLIGWSLFECTILARDLGKPEQYVTRSFGQAIASTRSFLKALRESKILNEDINRTVPVGLVLVLGGPTDDFIAGRIFEAVANATYKDTYCKNGSLVDCTTDKKSQAIIARNAFSVRNCELLLR